MSAFLFALVAVALTSLGSRDQLLIARISGTLGSNAGLLITGCLVAVITAVAMAYGGQYIAAMLPAAGKMMLVAFALMMAAAELAWPNKIGLIKEPTRSLGAIALVLLFRQFGDASRFTIFAFAAATGTPWFAAAGGAFGGVLAVVLAWSMGDTLTERLPLRPIRIALAALLAVAAIVIGLSARGLI